FAFTLNGGMLHAAPTATLSASDAGSYTYSVNVSDGITPVSIEVALHVAALPPPLVFTTQSLPNGRVGAPYSQAVQASGGVGTITVSLTAGTLPTGMGFTAGILTGTPTQHVDFPLTFEA